MNRYLTPLAALALSSSVSAQSAPALAHVRNSFELAVPAAYPDAAALFGPAGERAWAGEEWNPHFLYPLPEQDVEGAVFTVEHGAHKSVWVNSIRDLDARHFQYVYFIPDLLVTTIDVRFQPVDSRNTKVQVTYTRTAVSPEANAHVRAMGEGDRTSGPEWQQSLDTYLKSRRSK